jgi:hypothetical protein
MPERKQLHFHGHFGRDAADYSEVAQIVHGPMAPLDATNKTTIPPMLVWTEAG